MGLPSRMMLVTFLCGYSPRKPLDIICFSTSRLPPANRSPNTLPRFSATCFATSTPTSSTSVAAPTGKPKLVVRESSFLGPTPSWIGSKAAPQGRAVPDSPKGSLCCPHKRPWAAPTSLLGAASPGPGMGLFHSGKHKEAWEPQGESPSLS